MHEILRELPAGARVLDLGCAAGSFHAGERAFFVVRLDYEGGRPALSDFVQADAARLPFPNASFDTVICNHSLEHFEQLSDCLAEIGRVVKRDGSLYVAVPDSSTVSDRLYRWLARGGGHVNAFTCASDLASRIECATGLPHRATRILCTSLSCLNRKNRRSPAPRRLMLVGGGTEFSLHLLNAAFRWLDRALHSRLAVYGWALYFGNIAGHIETQTWPNVCIRCGSGQAPAQLVLRRRLFFPTYRCGACGATNVYFDDQHCPY